MTPRFVVAVSLAILLASCAARNPNDYYDVAATEKMGRIISKQVVAVDTRPTAEAHGAFLFLPVTVHGVGYLVMLSNPIGRGSAKIDIFEYVVQTPDGVKTSVLGEYRFDVGTCVKLFLSSRPSYPRIAPGWDCEP